VSGGVFVDWLAVSQLHGEGTPEYVGSLHVRALGTRGDRLREDAGCAVGAGPVAHRGSYSTRLSVQSHAGWVRVSGNPGRFGRPDNLFGYDLDECMGIVNEQLERLKLPAFTRGTPVAGAPNSRTRGSQAAQRQASFAERDKWTGAAFSRLDITQNRTAGSEANARLLINAYQSRAKGYVRASNYGDETALFSNTRRAVECYRKGPEMVKHAPESAWSQWATDTGVVRVEVRLQSRVLSETNLRYWGNLNMAVLHGLFLRETAFLEGIDADVRPAGVEIVPARSRIYYAAWLAGRDVRGVVSRASLYRHRKAIRESAGVDIARPRQGGTVVPLMRPLDVRVAEPPVGYWEQAA
jgi:hypothetical protein